MDLRDELMTVAELAVGIGGFSAVIVAFLHSGRLRESDTERFRALITIAGYSVGLAFVPSLLENSGLSGSPLWKVASGVMIAAWFAGMIPFGLRIWNLRQEKNPELVPTVGYVAAFTVPSIANLIVQVGNFTGAAWEPTGTAYLLGTLVWLWAAGLMFAGLVLNRPAA